MQAKHHALVSASLFLFLALTGCSRSAKTPNVESQPSASQSSTNPGASDNGSQVPPTIANSEADADKQQAANAAPLVIPAGTSITIRLQQGLSSASAVPGERFDGVIDQPILLDGRTVLPAGAPVTGHVVIARRSGRLHHPGELGLTLDSVLVNNQQVSLSTSHMVARGASHKKRNLGWIGGGSGGGALIGALAGGGKGALIGGGIGAVAGTTTAFITGKKNVGFGAERRLTFRLTRDINLTA